MKFIFKIPSMHNMFCDRRQKFHSFPSESRKGRLTQQMMQSLLPLPHWGQKHYLSELNSCTRLLINNCGNLPSSCPTICLCDFRRLVLILVSWSRRLRRGISYAFLNACGFKSWFYNKTSNFQLTHQFSCAKKLTVITLTTKKIFWNNFRSS